MRRIAIVALMVLLTLAAVTTSAEAAGKTKPGKCKVVKGKHGKKHRSCPKTKPETPAKSTTPSAPTVPSTPTPAPTVPAPTSEPAPAPAPPAAASITIDPATPTATLPFTISTANLPPLPEGGRYVFAARLLAVPYSSCVYGFNLPDVNVPQVADPTKATGGSRTWCTGSWRGSVGLVTTDGVRHPEALATIDFTITG